MQGSYNYRHQTEITVGFPLRVESIVLIFRGIVREYYGSRSYDGHLDMFISLMAGLHCRNHTQY